MAGVVVGGGGYGGGPAYPPGGGVVVSPPPAYGAQYSANCQIDRNPIFYRGVDRPVSIQGASVTDLLSQCRQMAYSRLGGNSSSLIDNLQVYGAPRGSLLATCDIDNSVVFRGSFIRVGTLAASSMAEAQQDCQQIARSALGAVSSANVTGQGYAP
jgi:hypothetical protein